MPKSRDFLLCDVFSDRVGAGNGLAVVLDGSGLSTERMQAFAAYINQSETTFVLPPTQPGASYRIRIFTPVSELPFAGHPSVGSAHAVLEAGLAQASDTIVPLPTVAGFLSKGFSTASMGLSGDTLQPVPPSPSKNTLAPNTPPNRPL